MYLVSYYVTLLVFIGWAYCLYDYEAFSVEALNAESTIWNMVIQILQLGYDCYLFITQFVDC